jgi:hypothetical protein
MVHVSDVDSYQEEYTEQVKILKRLLENEKAVGLCFYWTVSLILAKFSPDA